MIRPVAARDARRALQQKGFVLVSTGNRDHELYFLVVDGRRTDFHVKISRGTTELRKDNIKVNARETRVTGDDLYRILCCEHDAARTVAIYRARPAG